VSATEHEPDMARRAHRRQAELASSLAGHLRPGETVVAHQGAIMVTDHRLLFAWKLSSGWHSDAISFDEVTGWSLGRQHDERPMLRLEHPTHIRTGRVAAHHVLWFSWGNAEAGLPHDDITMTFAGKRDRAFLAALERLQQTDVAPGEEFVVAPPGTREERTRGSHGSQAYLTSDGP
jgi:hypothetical protein